MQPKNNETAKMIWVMVESMGQQLTEKATRKYKTENLE